jgi:hypothetical protein
MTDEQHVGDEDLADAGDRPQAQPNAGRSEGAATEHELHRSPETTQKKKENP